jgi:uncharacterized phage protein gp47/JayE
MTDFGITGDGFTLKPFDTILSDMMDRARQAFDADVDLTPTSPLRKILEVTSAEHGELWKFAEDLYYANFVSAAIGGSLDLLGDDVGISRLQLFSAGQVQFTLANPAAGRSYLIPQGAVLVTSAPIQAFYTTAPLTLDGNTTQGSVEIQAFERGPAGNVAAGAIVDVEPQYRQFYLNLGTATLTVTNPAAFLGGETLEADDDYRVRMLGFPRTIWTVASVEAAAAGVDGVIDVEVFDPLGGVDVSQSYFNLFAFGERLFSGDRHLGEPYFFSVVVAHDPAWPWRTQGPVTGIFERVFAAVDAVRPVGIFVNIVEADHIEVGLEAQIVIQAGYDPQAILAATRQAIATDVGALRLGHDVLYSQIMRAIVQQPGVLDVQNMHLRRCPPAFGRFTFGEVPFQAEIIEVAAGENLIMGQTEIAIFRFDSDLSALELVAQ